MCGIAGFASAESAGRGEFVRAVVARMTNRLRHRGPDDGGIWIDDRQCVALGHRRLSIIDLSPQGHQPMVSASGRFVLVFNGEIYNFAHLRSELSGYPFRGMSDTEVMLASFEAHGVLGSLKRFNGMFAFALWDNAEQVLHLSCDRFGEKPLYYGVAGRSLVFGSELKALTAHPDFDQTIDRRVVQLFLKYSYVPKPYSIYEHARKVEPGTCMSFRLANVPEYPEPEVYWSARDAAAAAIRNPFRGTTTDAADELENLLADSVRMRMVSDVPLGAFLSGGIDSTTIVALMQKYGSRRARTFTIGFVEQPYNEANEARAVAAYLGTDHTELCVTPAEAMAVIPRLGSIYDEPFADSSQVPTFLVSELARQQVTVSLSGDGGDEVFGGYNRYVWAGEIWNRVGRVPRGVRSLLAGVSLSISPGTWDRISILAPASLKGKSPGTRMHKLASILDAKNPEELYHRLITQVVDPRNVGSELPVNMTNPANWDAVPTYLQRMMLIDVIGYLPNDILVKVDRAAMAVSLETRTPFLDHRLFEFAWSLPDEWRVREGTGKWLLRQFLYKHVPREMLERPKAGFGIPIDVWMRGPLRDWAEHLLGEKRLREEGFLDPGIIRRKWAQHVSGSHNWYSQLWAVLMFESWLDTRREVDSTAGASFVNLVS